MRSMLRVALLSLLVASTPLVAQQPNDTTHRAGWDWDLSSVLSSRRGFIPVPFAFGDPVVGFGGGLAVVFYRPPPAGKLDTVDMRRPPPSAGLGGVLYRSERVGLRRRTVSAVARRPVSLSGHHRRRIGRSELLRRARQSAPAQSARLHVRACRNASACAGARRLVPTLRRGRVRLRSHPEHLRRA